ncbi:MAG: anaerobic ribonucleoside-triphosphate reductase activating protein [Candidatus Bathyarchaeia archaeon]
MGFVLSVRLGGYIDLSTVDWSDHLTFMLFLAGCNLACPYCQNARLIPPDSGTERDLDSVAEMVLKGRRLLDAVGFSGGEPTLQPDAVAELSRRAKMRGLECFLNTNGTQPAVLRRLLDNGLLDHVAVDVKAPLETGRYGLVVGRPSYGAHIVEAVRESIQTCLDYKVSLELRTTVVPGLIGSKQDIEKIVTSLPVGSYSYVLQQFVPSPEVLDPSLTAAGSPSREWVVELARHALSLGLRDVFVRTKEFGMEKVGAS